MKHLKEHIQALKERYELKLASEFVPAAEIASKRYGIPVSKLSSEMIRSIAAKNEDVIKCLNDWVEASGKDEDTDQATGDAWKDRELRGYLDNEGQPLTIRSALGDVSLRLETARKTINEMIEKINIENHSSRDFWINLILERSTLVRIEAGETIVILGDIAISSNGYEKNVEIRSKLEEARTIRDDAKSLVDLAKAKQGIY
jgi:hypothetical protein